MKIEEGDGIENYSKKTLNFAKELRKSQTNAEGLLWYYLRNKQLGGYKFRRQQPIDKYIVDFVCFEKKLIIELDGSQHNEDKNIKHDKIRDSFLRSLGFTILRFWNDEIFTNCFNILDFILHKLENPRSYHPPLEASNLQNPRSYHPPLEGGSNGLMPFGEGAKDLNISSKPNFAENNSYPSPNLQANSTLPQGEGDLDRENNISPSPKSQILGSSTLPSKQILGEGDLDRENNISPSPNLQANSTLPSKKILGEGDKIGEGDLDRGGDGAEYIPRIDVEKNYPAIFTFLQKFQNQLEKRTDKGDHWTNLRNCAYLEEFEKEKIVYFEIVKQPQFYYDRHNFYLEATSFVMTGNNLKYLIAVLNSQPCAWIFKTFYAGFGLGSDGI